MINFPLAMCFFYCFLLVPDHTDSAAVPFPPRSRFFFGLFREDFSMRWIFESVRLTVGVPHRVIACSVSTSARVLSTRTFLSPFSSLIVYICNPGPAPAGRSSFLNLLLHALDSRALVAFNPFPSLHISFLPFPPLLL